ncbi:MAG: AMP-binding protein, partial [Oscillospiraceae bacterium]|nr:AMP-binding protein [Oscillospiraceae bacterium]
LESIEAFCHTGGVCSKDLKREWLEIIEPEKLYELYSMTECIGMTHIRGDEWLKHPGSVGKISNGDISIRDDDGNELPVGETGNIFMAWGGEAPKVIYKNVPPIEPDENGYRSVGDMGYLDADGYLYFADRRSDMIVSGGENVFAAEVEEVLKKHKKVNEAVVIGLPDKEWGHRIHAILETNEPTSSKELIKFALDYLPPYKIPKSFEFLDEIPRNDSGKFVRPQLIEESLKKGY